MTTALWIANVVVGLLVIADMLYGRHMAKKWMLDVDPCGYTCEECEEEADMDYAEAEMIQDDLLLRVDLLEKEVFKLKNTPKKKSTIRKKK